MTLANSNKFSSPINSLNAIRLTESDVSNALTNLNSHKANGIDNIAPSVLNNCACTLAVPLHYLSTTSLNTSIIPNEWKTHSYIRSFQSINPVTNKHELKIIPTYFSFT